MKKVVIGVAALVVAVVVVMVGRVDSNVPQPQSNEAALEGVCGEWGASRPADERTTSPVDVQSQEDEASSDDDPESEAEPLTEEEKREAAEEKAVNDFDDLTDRWQEASEKGVAMSDIDHFAKLFRAVPKERQDECIHRALNLIPDENVMLLAGVLMDKSMDREIVETVFNDVLNRDEDVKMPILQQIHKDKAHSCWKDADWILDVTDESPLSK